MPCFFQDNRADMYYCAVKEQRYKEEHLRYDNVVKKRKVACEHTQTEKQQRRNGQNPFGNFDCFFIVDMLCIIRKHMRHQHQRRARQISDGFPIERKYKH